MQGLHSNSSSHDTPSMVRTLLPLCSAQLISRTEVFGQLALGTSCCAENPSIADTFPPAGCQEAQALQEGVVAYEYL